jgi:hypothetical protein
MCHASINKSHHFSYTRTQTTPHASHYINTHTRAHTHTLTHTHTQETESDDDGSQEDEFTIFLRFDVQLEVCGRARDVA